MAYCAIYEQIEDKPEFLAKLIHAVQNDPFACWEAQNRVNLCQTQGVYDKVKFGREALKNQSSETQ